VQNKMVMAVLTGASATALAAAGGGSGRIASILPVSVQSAFTPAPVVPPPPLPVPPAYRIDPAVAASLAQWNLLRQSDSYPFSSYASFILAHRFWPGELSMRKAAERAINPDTSSPSEVLAFLRALPPLTNSGQARMAFALYASGRADEARDAARKAWTSGALLPADESRILGLFFGSLTPQDQDMRIAALLADGDRLAAGRILQYASAERRPVFETEIALQANASDAGTRLAALPTEDWADPGLIRDKANWLRNANQALAARQAFASRPALGRRPASPQAWFETMLILGREAANDHQWTIAYDIASKLDDAYPAGTDVSDRSFGERDAYTSLAWIAGSSALFQLGRPADAVRMFDFYAHAARSPQTRSKGFYWAGRAAAAAGRETDSQSYFEQAATAPDQFYGQLAIERLRRPIPPPPAEPASPTEAERAAFAARPVVQAARALGLMGRWDDQSLFVRAIAQSADDDIQRTLAADFGQSIGRLDLGVWVAREARNRGESFYARTSFPQAMLAPGFAQHWALAHAITRQESSFDRTAVSNAGARGMMQLMPGTARQVAGQLGLPYDFGRLTSDPSYNMMLGTSYFTTLLDQWGGNATLAIASYNAGVGNVRRWVSQNGDPRLPGADVVRWIENIPYPETRNYVQRVLENAVVYDTFGQGNLTRQNRLSFYLGKAGPG
jgi:soluble lytic murein transglycosylase